MHKIMPVPGGLGGRPTPWFGHSTFAGPRRSLVLNQRSIGRYPVWFRWLLTMKKVIWSIAAVLTTTLLLSSCGGSSDGPSTFVSHDQSGAMTISWTDDGNGNLAGSLQSTTPNPDGTGELVKTVNASFTGTLQQLQMMMGPALALNRQWPRHTPLAPARTHETCAGHRHPRHSTLPSMCR
jgi:hypothetical protein